MVRPTEGGSPSRTGTRGKAHVQELFWNTLGRLVLFYFIPLVILALFFHIQYRHLVRESLEAHLEVIAEHQANTFDLFLRERLVNLGNILDDPRFQGQDVGRLLPTLLRELRHTSAAFIDIGVVDPWGSLTHYEGPVTYTGPVDYRSEAWFQELLSPGRSSVITEIYLGFRDQPHSTSGVRRGEAAACRASDYTTR